MIDPFATHARRLMIFGHPGHELALFGLLQRYRPLIVIITDGGGEERVEESRAGLSSIALAESAVFLRFREAAFYEALLDNDIDFFWEVSEALHTEIARAQAEQIFCDAIEFYNPVHDMTLPLVLRAGEGLAKPRVFEVPLVYQMRSTVEAYQIQRVPDELKEYCLDYELNPEELRLEVLARDFIYRNLRGQVGPEFLSVTQEHLAREEIAVAGDPFKTPQNSGKAIRYEWRAQELQKKGIIKRVITYADHWLPITRALMDGF